MCRHRYTSREWRGMWYVACSLLVDEYLKVRLHVISNVIGREVTIAPLGLSACRRYCCRRTGGT